jgi:TolA-binding protein
MNVVDLHPEDLLDKDARGVLTDAERVRLESHLARCTTCRFERELRADFADEVEEEFALSSQRLLALVEGIPQPDLSRPAEVAPPKANVEAEVEAEDDTPARPPTPSSRPSRVRRNARMVLLVAAALFVGSVATAGAGAGVWARIASTLSANEAETIAPPAALATATPKAKPPQAHVESTRAPEPAPEETAEPIATALPAPPVLAAPSLAPTATVAPKPVAVVAEPAETAATMFESANEARRKGDYARAIFLHRRLQTIFPSSREAQVSYGTVGRLLLDRGDAESALVSFDSYRARGHGPLDEAVLAGRATALERLGRFDEARSAWSALLEAFPDTAYAEHARARLGAAPPR